MVVFLPRSGHGRTSECCSDDDGMDREKYYTRDEKMKKMKKPMYAKPVRDTTFHRLPADGVAMRIDENTTNTIISSSLPTSILTDF